MSTASYAHLLRKAADIADDREPQYGEALQNLKDIAATADAMFGLKLSAVQVAQLLVALKFRRERTKHKEDNLLDAINYTAMLLQAAEAETPPATS